MRSRACGRCIATNRGRSWCSPRAASLTKSLSPTRVRPVIEVAIRRFRAHQALCARLEEAQATLADRVVIERAKGILMQRRRLSEEDAYRMLRRWAMDRGKKLAHVAQQFLRDF
jgi:two-component system, response regulator / RNA-binding antiterminator